MAIGPVQLIVLGFNHPEFHGEIIAELERPRESDTVTTTTGGTVFASRRVARRTARRVARRR